MKGLLSLLISPVIKRKMPWQHPLHECLSLLDMDGMLIYFKRHKIFSAPQFEHERQTYAHQTHEMQPDTEAVALLPRGIESN